VASIFRRTYKRPIPEGAEFVTRKGKRLARWKDGRGRTHTAPLSEDGTEIVLELRSWYFEYNGPDGRRITVKGYPDREATEQMARDKEKLAARIKAGCVQVDMDRAAMPLKEALDAWLADLRRRGRAEDYVYNMGLLVTRAAEACHWPTLGAIRSDSLMAWLADLKEGRAVLPCRKKRGPRTLSGRSLNQYLETCRAFVNWCCAQRPLPWLPGNPLEGIAPADESEKRREKRALTLEELGRLKAASGRRWAIYLTAALTGLRRSELKRLEWGDVRLDAEHPYIQLRAAATKAKRADVVPINPELLEALEALRPEAPGPGDRVFKAIPKYGTYRKDVEARAKIPWRDGQDRLASFHCLRKTFGTYLALADVPLRVAMDLMRVTEAKLLTGIYTDAKLLNTSAAAARLPRLVRPPEEEGGSAGAAAG
jgi:integrase